MILILRQLFDQGGRKNQHIGSNKGVFLPAILKDKNPNVGRIVYRLVLASQPVTIAGHRKGLSRGNVYFGPARTNGIFRFSSILYRIVYPQGAQPVFHLRIVRHLPVITSIYFAQQA